MFSASLTGLLFSVGLGLGGMTDPARVLAFLDVSGKWDASLAFVMAGGLAVYALLRPLILRRPAPLLDPIFAPVPGRLDRPDARLVGGAVLFGVGWGLSGYCPGPAVTSLATGQPRTLLFGAAMFAGAALWEAVQRFRARSTAGQPVALTPLSGCD